MYLSRIQIDIDNRQKIKNLTHLGAFHNWVEHCFPIEIETHKRCRHLWRIDQLAGKRYLLLLSEEKPDLTEFVKYGVSKTAMIKNYEPFLAQIKEDQIMQFRLTANPTHAIKNPGHNQPRIVPHITVEQQKNWLITRSEKFGFQLTEQISNSLSSVSEMTTFDIVNRDWPILRHGGRTIRLSRVTFEGILRVKDYGKFKQALEMGIGREKGFGMGLMTVIPRS
ncbi:MAG: type I-E CRISPR-associated protein Cas6/Cse3/CasE [Liquorilactobacillus ghanensis]|uniref:type I-E CRISPR-associated protein Cas6/Cse3/CasE n=1 Tax=Liquorilactobacillus ghanensis TaxID=399370 RepID=UPI0039EA87B1